jgi:hypothetical protein
LSSSLIRSRAVSGNTESHAPGPAHDSGTCRAPAELSRARYPGKTVWSAGAILHRLRPRQKQPGRGLHGTGVDALISHPMISITPATLPDNTSDTAGVNLCQLPLFNQGPHQVRYCFLTSFSYKVEGSKTNRVLIPREYRPRTYFRTKI